METFKHASCSPPVSSQISFDSDSSEPPSRRTPTAISKAKQLRRVAQSRRQGLILSPTLTQSSAIAKGMKELDNFGFRTSSTQLDPTGFVFLTEKKKNGGFHVTDLWSQKQQQEFLKMMRLERAQYARERHVAFMNFLIQQRKKMAKPVDADQLYERILHDVNPDIAAKYTNAGQNGAVFRLITNQATLRCRSELPLNQVPPFRRVNRMARQQSVQIQSVPMKKRLNLVEDFIGHCKFTLKHFHKESQNLAFTARSTKDDDPSGKKVRFSLPNSRSSQTLSQPRVGRHVKVESG